MFPLIKIIFSDLLLIRLLNNRIENNISSNNFSLNAQIELLNMTNFAVFKQAQINTQIAVLSEKEILLNYQLRMVEYFFSIVQQQELLKLQQQQLINSKHNFERVKKEVDAGAKPMSDLYDIEYIFNAEQIDIQQSEQLLSRLKLEFIQFLNVSEALIDFTLVITDHQEFQNVEYVFNPGIAKLQANKELYIARQSLLRASMMPTLSSFYEFGSFYSKMLGSENDKLSMSFSDQIENNKSHFIGISFRLPIFQGGTVARKKRANRAQQLVSEQELLQAKVDLEQKNNLIDTHLEQLATLEGKFKS